MELIDRTQDAPAKARTELEALINVGTALAQQLKGKLIQWGERMEEDARQHG